MKNVKHYYLYIFIATLTRNIVDVYSLIFLYQKNFLVKEIIYIYALVYFFGIYLSNLFLAMGNKIGYKYIFILSSIITSVTFYVINNSNNIYLISLFLSLSIFTYHPVKHYYGMFFLKHKKEIGNTLIFTYIAVLLSSYIVIKNINVMGLLIISLVSIIPILFMKKVIIMERMVSKKISTQKLKFFIFDQFRIIFLLLEPLYLYILANDIVYVGIFNIILTIAAIVYIYMLVRKINIYKYYKYLNILFSIILVLKLFIINKNILLIIAFLEGIGIKTNELVSTMNLYSGSFRMKYIIDSEKIFCITRVIILSMIYFLPLNLKTILLFLVIGVFVLSFQYKKNT